MKKNRIRLTESQLHRVIKESVKRVLSEIGDTSRGQYMLGRISKRAYDNGDARVRSMIGDRLPNSNNKDLVNSFNQGWDDEQKTDNQKYRRINFNYGAAKMKDMDNIGRKFIDFIEHYQRGVLLQTVVDFESGNQTGTPTSPLNELIPYFEDEVLGYETTPDIKQAIKRAYNSWWVYAEDQLMPSEEEF